MPDSLKQQALALLAVVENSEDACCSWDFTTIREALKSIPEPMTELSPATQAVLNALYMDELNGPQQLMARSHAAAALRTATQHCVPDDSEGHWIYVPHILAIADELEAQ